MIFGQTAGAGDNPDKYEHGPFEGAGKRKKFYTVLKKELSALTKAVKAWRGR
jgi:hypothetical protein